MKIFRYIPNTITSMNLLCGIMGVIFTLKGELNTALYLMLAGAVCDFCDGLAARALKAYSELGKQLDSLADMVTFGTLPAIMMHKLMLDVYGDKFWSYIPLLIAVFSALRLAKFNIDERQSDNFIGLATPACAILCGSFVCSVIAAPASQQIEWIQEPWYVPAISLILCALLVCEIPMFSMKFKKSPENKQFRYQRIIFIVLALLSVIPVLLNGANWTIIPLTIFLGYILINLVFYPFIRMKIF